MERAQGSKPVCVVTPVYNDWESLDLLIADLGRELERNGLSAEILVVDDGSDLSSRKTFTKEFVGPGILGIRTIRMRCNLGHQRAIVSGLTYALKNFDAEGFLTMDSDGEDSPTDAVRMIKKWELDRTMAVVARRSKRSESDVFRVSYVGYKLLFRILTGRRIDFGNFCILPRVDAETITYREEAWSHYASSIVKARIRIARMDVNRSKRYRGFSKMNYSSLVSHGIASLAVFLDVVLARCLVATTVLGALFVAGMIAVVYITSFTGYGIPGWGTTAAGVLGLALVQVLSVQIVTILVALAWRMKASEPPALIARTYISGEVSF